MTSRYFGNATDLLATYAWYEASSQSHAWPVGSLMPNELGLFDMLGNVYEWCQDRYETRRQGKMGNYSDYINISESIREQYPRLLRGGTFDFHPKGVRAANRGGNAPSSRGTLVGFRPARTYP